MANVAALMIPYQYLDKVFLSHLHTDYMGEHARKYGLEEQDWRKGYFDK